MRWKTLAGNELERWLDGAEGRWNIADHGWNAL